MFVPLHAIALDRSIEHRLLTVVHRDDATQPALADDPRFAIYTPMTERRLASHSSRA